VSLTSAERFAAKVRARRRRRILTALGVTVVLVLAVWGVLGSSWATVHRLEVIGVQRTDPGIARAAGEREEGQPLLLARLDQVRAEVASQPLVRRVAVTRHWPSTLRIQVVERQPVAAVPATAQGDGKLAAKGSMRLVDEDGVTIATVARAALVPSGMRVFNVDVTTSRGVPALRSCLAVSAALPHAIRAQVTAIGATSPDGIWLQLRTGAKVQWGDSTQSGLKAQVLAALLRQHAKAYDLRAPGNPAVRI
jgi:cell division protein FtsQ